MASTGPSRMSHVKFFLSLLALRHSCAKMPSVHSFAMISSAPNIWGDVMAFGLSRHSLRECLGEHFHETRLTDAGRPNRHERVTDEAHLVHLHNLGDPIHVHLEAKLLYDLGHHRLDERVLGLIGLDTREQVINQRQEKRHVLSDKFGEVHVTQGAHEEHRLSLLRDISKCAAAGASRAEHCEDVAQAKVVVCLLGQLLLAEPVEHVEFLGEHGRVYVSRADQLDLHDDLAVGDHHGDAAVERLEVLRELLTPGITGIHCDEVAYLFIASDNVTIGELECFALLTDRREDAANLLRGDREHLEIDAVEFIEAAPAA
eukprot:scaffold11206_cov117-Isochrysis_galbana.AAC.19